MSDDDLLLVHQDYLAMFTDLLVFRGARSFTGAQRRMKAAKEQLRKRRLEFEPVREKVRIIANQLEKTRLSKDENAFVQAVVRYLPSARLSLPHSAATSVIEYLNSDITPAQFDTMINRTMQAHRNAWSDVSEAYATLKIDSVPRR